MDPGISTFATVIITLIVMAIFGGGFYILLRFTFPLFNNDEDEPTLADLYELTDRFAKSQQNINDQLTRLATNQQKLINELKTRLDKLKRGRVKWNF